MKRSTSEFSRGYSFIELLMAMGMLSIGAVAFMQLTDFTKKSSVGNKMLLDVNNYRSLLLRVIRDNEFCTLSLKDADITSDISNFTGEIKGPQSTVISKQGHVYGKWKVDRLELKAFESEGGSRIGTSSLEVYLTYNNPSTQAMIADNKSFSIPLHVETDEDDIILSCGGSLAISSGPVSVNNHWKEDQIGSGVITYWLYYLDSGSSGVAVNKSSKPNATLDVNGSMSMSGNVTLSATNFQSNVFIGVDTGINNETGTNLTAVGYEALSSNTTGNYNTAMGYEAMTMNLGGSENTAFGAYALQENTSGQYNTAIGHSALKTNISGSYNVAVGVSALADNPTGTYNTAIGYEALAQVTSGSYNTAIGAGALKNSTGSYNTAVGVGAGANCNGNYNTFLGYGTSCDPSLTTVENSTAIGANTVITASNQVRLGDGNVTEIVGRRAYSVNSDARLKERIREIQLGIDFIMQLRPVQFLMKKGNKKLNYGFIAQDVMKINGAALEEANLVGGSEKTFYYLGYSGLIAPIVKALQQQRELIDELKEEREFIYQRIESALQMCGQTNSQCQVSD
jgi:hypothetical protein